MDIRVAILGTGYIGRIHAQAVKNTPGMTLHAAVDWKPDTLAAFLRDFDIPHGYDNLDGLLKVGSLDAVVICAPNYLHAPMAIAALNAGISVMVEKPMAMNPEEGEAMLTGSEQSGASLMVAHCWRFDREVQWLRNQVSAGLLGRIVRTKAYGVHSWWGPSGWFTQKKFSGGGALVDMGVHALDTTRFLLGDPTPKTVYARIGTEYGPYDVDDTGLLIVTWENGIESYIESGWWQPHMDMPEAGTQMYGTVGYGQIFPSYLDKLDLFSKEVQHIDPGFPATRVEHCEQSMYDRQMAHFVECVQNHKAPNPGGKEGLVALKLLAAAYESSKTGKAIDLD